MFLKVMPLGCRATSGFLVTCTFRVGKCGSHTTHTQLTIPQHNTHRPTVTLKQVFTNDHSSARNDKQQFSSPSPPQSSIPSSSYISRCDLVPSISYPDLFHCLQWTSFKFSNNQCVRLRLCRAQRSRVLFGTLDMDDTITHSHSYAAETLLLFAVMIRPIRVRFLHRFLRHCSGQNCPDTLWFFRIHSRVRAVHPSIVQVLGNSFWTDSLDQLFDVISDVQPIEHEIDCNATSQ